MFALSRKIEKNHENLCYPYIKEKCKVISWDCAILIPPGAELSFLSKGTDSVVYLLSGFVLKASRTDRMIPMNREADILRVIRWRSTYKIAPKVFANTKYCLLMERVQGDDLLRLAEKSERNELKKRVISILAAARELDRIGINHGELARPGKHVLFAGESPVFIDFGSATITTNASNLTQISSQLFFSHSTVSSLINRKLGINEAFRQELIELLRLYKKRTYEPSSREEVFKEILEKIEKTL